MFRALLSAILLSAGLSVAAEAARPSLSNIPTRHDSELLFSAGKAWELHLAARPALHPALISDATGGAYRSVNLTD